MNVYIKDNKMYVVSDYSAEFVKEARKLNGKWSGGAWLFDANDEEMVRDVLLKVYGEDGKTAVETVNVEVTIDDIAGRDSIELFGRVLAKRFNRDGNVTLHDSVVVKKGGFPDHGGSRSNPALNYSDNTVLLVKNVPLTLVQKELENYPNSIKIVSEKKVDKDALLKEKELLLQRLDEIEELLKYN